MADFGIGYETVYEVKNSFRPAFAASYEDVNEFLGKGHYKKLYQVTPRKYFPLFDLSWFKYQLVARVGHT